LQYLEDNAEYYVELDSEVRLVLDTKCANLEMNLNEYLFIEVYAFVLDKLREYFNMFKNS